MFKPGFVKIMASKCSAVATNKFTRGKINLKKKLKSAMFFFNTCHLNLCLSHIHNPFEAVCIKMQPILNYLVGYLTHLILKV
jgi:hypothetical protein